MRSCATRSTNRYGPAQTGLAQNLSPAASAAFGETIMPAEITNRLNNGPESGLRRFTRTVRSSMTSTLTIGAERGLIGRTAHPAMAVDAVFHRRGVERLPVMKPDPGTQLQLQAPCGRPTRTMRLRAAARSAVGRDIDQLVAHGTQHDLRRPDARRRRIQMSGSVDKAMRSVVALPLAAPARPSASTSAPVAAADRIGFLTMLHSPAAYPNRVPLRRADE